MNKLKLYAKLPEMRLFWIFLPFLIILLVINILYLPKFLAFISAGVFLILGFIILINNLRLARSNLEVKIERNELSSIILNLRDGIIAYDSNFKILIFNRAAEQIFDFKAETVIGQNLTPDKSRETRFKLLAQVFFPSLAPTVVRHSEPGAYPQIADLSFENPHLELRIITDKIVDPRGQLLGFVKLIHDRTREVELLRNKTEFITVASHQLRTPLTGVNWALESLVKEELNEGQKELVRMASEATAKLAKTVNDLLDVSKIEEGKFGYKFEQINIVDFLREIVKDAEILAKKTGIKVYFQKPAETSILAPIDGLKLRMVFLNLIDNAIRYNVPNGEVILAIERVENKPYVIASVKDTGLGIPADQMGKLFTKFFRAENVVKSQTEGSGLGLYIVKNIVKRHGGDIRVESEINRGSTFYITLPTDLKLIPQKEIVYGEE
jgi:signal transduction histidine kinase